MDNDYGLVLTLLECHNIQLNNEIYDCAAFGQAQGLSDPQHDYQSKDLILVMYFHNLGNMMCFSIICRNPDAAAASCHSMHMCSPLLLEVCDHFLQIKPCSWIFF